MDKQTDQRSPADSEHALTDSRHARPLLPLWAATTLAAVAGLALDAAFPSLGWWPLAFVAVSLSLLTFIGRSLWGAVLVGAVFGAAFSLPHLSWSARFLGDQPLGWLPWIALAASQTLLFAVLAPPITLSYRLLSQRHCTVAIRLLALPALVSGAWLLRELIMGSWPYGGFPWGRVGMSQSESPLAQAASWVGVSGLGFLMVALCATAIEAVRLGMRRHHRRVWVLPVPALGLLVMLLLVPQFPTTEAGTIRIGAVQGNGPAAFTDRRQPNAVLNSQLEASMPLEKESVDLVVWPEGGVDRDPRADEATAQTLRDASARYGAPLLVNAASAQDQLVYNTTFLWTPAGPEATHAKRHPVPFGEYVPDRQFFGALVPSLVNLIQREYTAGTDAPAVTVGDVTVSLAICFDVIFDDVIYEGINSGAEVLVLQTNNADFRGTDENLQQLAVARMRAIETGRSVVNISTTGTSQMFAPDGTTLATLPVDEPGHMIGDLELRRGTTAAVVIGGAVELVLMAGTALALITLGVAQRRSAARR